MYSVGLREIAVVAVALSRSLEIDVSAKHRTLGFSLSSRTGTPEARGPKETNKGVGGLTVVGTLARALLACSLSMGLWLFAKPGSLLQ